MSQKESGVVDAPEKKVRTKKEYSAEFIQKTVCDYYRSGTSLAAFCKASNLPYTTVWDWVEKFTDKYPVMASKDVSKDEQTRALEEECVVLKKVDQIVSVRAGLWKDAARVLLRCRLGVSCGGLWDCRETI